MVASWLSSVAIVSLSALIMAALWLAGNNSEPPVLEKAMLREREERTRKLRRKEEKGGSLVGAS